jgi:sugar phosphate permease
LLLAYAAFYLCRANVEPALNLLAIEHHYDNEQVGLVLSVALAAYAAGKLVLGPLSDVFGGKRVLVALLTATAVVSLAIAATDAPRRFGAATGLVVIGALVVANRFVQAGGWGGLVDVVDATFDSTRRGTVMGILSTSYDVGNVVALLLSAGVVRAGGGWRALFVVNPLIVLAVALVVRFALPASQARARPEAKPSAYMGSAGRLSRQSAFWFAMALSFLLTFVRAGFMTWTPRFLYEVSVASNVTSPTSGAIAKSAFFGVCGIMGSVITGRLSDRLGAGRRAPIMAFSLALLLASTLALAHAGVRSPWLATAGVGACGLFLLGPYSLLAGAISLDVAEGRGAATASSLVDAIGYVGASLSAFVLGSVSKRVGWTAAFDVVATAAGIALLLASIWSLRQNARHARTADGEAEGAPAGRP